MKPEELKKLTEEFSQIDRIIEMVPALRKMPVVEVGEILQALQDEHVFFVLEHFPLREQGLLFAEFPMARQLDLFRTISRKRFAEVFEHMPSDIRVDFFQHITQDEQATLLPYLSKKVREDVIHLSAYPPDTAGGIMSTDFATVQRDMTCAKAIRKRPASPPSKSTAHYVYGVDENQTMLGFITLKDPFTGVPNTLVAKVLHKDFSYVSLADFFEKGAPMREKYDLLAMPELNKEDQLEGIITSEGALDLYKVKLICKSEL